MSLNYKLWKSPIGDLHIVASEKALVTLTFAKTWPKLKKDLKADLIEKKSKILDQTQQELSEYFKGRRKNFSIPLAPAGTVFQTQTWKALEKIPFGKTRSYLEQAKTMGRTKAIRAVGTANGRNPIAIIIPCHRVIGSNGKLTGYAGGLDIKETLLKLEGVSLS
ncbi:MAG: methylated-DNA--[protein]-cysteine S-methyltransferase [Pseudobdellovibrionaceae bacterium]